MGKTLTTFTIGGVLGAAMFGGLAIASAGTPSPSEPRPAVVVDPGTSNQALQASMDVAGDPAQETPAAPSVATVVTAPSAPTPAAPAATKAPAPTVKKSTTTTTKVVKPPVKKVVADSANSVDSVDSAPSADS